MLTVYAVALAYTDISSERGVGLFMYKCMFYKIIISFLYSEKVTLGLVPLTDVHCII